MPMLTDFGRILRKLRLDYNEVLKNMADRLGFSSSYLSAIEVGKRNIPGDFIERLTALYGLTADQEKELERAKTQRMNEVPLQLDNASLQKKEFALMFARTFDALDEQTMTGIKKLIAKHTREE
jgi:transcriptional regulator with XRE-family HTH domain